MNDMMGPPPGSFKRGERLDEQRYPMPDPETKVRPRQEYNDSAVISHMAVVAETYVAAHKDDGRHMFFQFQMAPEEERTCSFVIIVWLQASGTNGELLFDTSGEPIMELWFVLITATCMNMGSRNASKIAQRYTDRLLEGFLRYLTF